MAGQTPPDNTAPAKADTSAPVDQDALTIKDLAKGVLTRQFRPRAASIRRLAEAALDSTKPRKKGGKKGAAKPAAKKGKKSKLARIPGQKAARKG